MGWFILAQLFSILIALVSLSRLSVREKDLEILLLRQHISILLRNRDQPLRATQVEKQANSLWRQALHIFPPNTPLS
jgi:hypothetical protein